MEEFIFFAIALFLFFFAYILKKNQNASNNASLEELGKEYLKHLMDNISSMPTEQLKNKEPKKVVVSYKNPCSETNYDCNIIPFFYIVYATQSGTSKKFADSLYNEATEHLKLKCALKNISELTSAKEFNENALFIFIVSTYGEGGPTDDSIEFNAMISKEDFWTTINNKQINYAMFGLGNSLYTKFNQQAKFLSKIFNKNKIQCLCDLGIGDDSKEINADFDQWKNRKLLPRVYDFFLRNKEAYQAFTQKAKLPTVSKEEMYQMELCTGKSKEDILGTAYEHSVNKFFQTIKSKIDSIIELRQNNTNGSTLKVTFALEDPKQTYSPGANIGIYPKNIMENVNKILSQMHYDPDLTINYKFKTEEAKKQKLNLPIPVNTTIKEALTSIIDLSGQISKDLLSKIAQFAGDEEHYNSLSQIINNKQKFEEFSSKRYNIIDIITEYDSISIPFITFSQIMPKMRPRFYTVASSPNQTKGKFDIVIALVEWDNYQGNKRLGLTSNYFQNLFTSNPTPLNEYTQVTIKDSSFKLPNDPHQPILMIATGTGVAPFISFLQEMAFNNEHPYESYLIFGTKNKTCDYIYEKELKGFLENKCLTQLYCAFSRDQQEKVYVQDILMKEFKEKLIELVQKNIKIYICGSLSMGKTIVETLELILGSDVFKKMSDNKMIVKELWENK